MKHHLGWSYVIFGITIPLSCQTSLGTRATKFQFHVKYFTCKENAKAWADYQYSNEGIYDYIVHDGTDFSQTDYSIGANYNDRSHLLEHFSGSQCYFDT